MKAAIKKAMNMINTPGQEKPNHQKWDVYIGKKLIDTVTYPVSESSWRVRRALVYQEGYPGNIEVQESE